MTHKNSRITDAESKYTIEVWMQKYGGNEKVADYSTDFGSTAYFFLISDSDARFKKMMIPHAQ